MSATKTPREQVVYANILFYGCWGSLALLVLTYLAYVFGIVTPYVPLETITTLWSQPVGVYLEKANVPHGWGWAGLLGKGDFMNFIGIALLAGMTIVCYVPLVTAFFKRNDKIYGFIALLEIIVLCVAASGIFGSGGH